MDIAVLRNAVFGTLILEGPRLYKEVLGSIPLTDHRISNNWAVIFKDISGKAVIEFSTFQDNSGEDLRLIATVKKGDVVKTTDSLLIAESYYIDIDVEWLITNIGTLLEDCRDIKWQTLGS